MLACALLAIGLIAVGCGEDDDDGSATSEPTTAETGVPGASEAATLQDEIAELGDEQQIEAVGEAWADLFGTADSSMCAYLHPDLGGESSCSSTPVGR